MRLLVVLAIIPATLALSASPVPRAADGGESKAHTAALANSGAPQDSGPPSQANPEITVKVNRSFVLEQPGGVRRISIAAGDIAEAVAASTREILLNGKSPGDTTLLVWDTKGGRRAYEVHVVPSTAKFEAIQKELAREVGSDVSLSTEDGTVFLRGTVQTPTAADRANTIASTLGRVVNLLRISVPPTEPQVMLKVRFADIDRSAALQVGVNLFSMDPYKGISTSTTGQFGTPPSFSLTRQNGQTTAPWTISNLLNLFYYNPEINVGAILQDLQTRNILQILAEPNLLTASGKAASFLAGGEFPFPTLQGGAAGIGQITIQFKEFGIRLNFLPTITPRGTIRLVVTPEVSALDYSNGLTVSGYTIPGLSTRRVQTEVELENGQSFVIAGLLDNQVTEQFNKMPGISSIPILGKLFQSKSVNRSNNELLVTVTPELVGPLPASAKRPNLKFPNQFMESSPASAIEQPGPEVTGPVMPVPKVSTLPIEELKNPPQAGAPAPSAGAQLPGVPSGLTLQPAQPAPGGGNPPNGSPNK